MSISLTYRNTSRSHSQADFFLSRRPVIDRHHHLIAQEIRFGRVPQPQTSETENGVTESARPTTLSSAPSTVVRDALVEMCEFGLARVIGELECYIEIDGDALISDVLDAMPKDRVALEINLAELQREGVRAAFDKRVQEGYRLYIVMSQPDDAILTLIPNIKGVRVDISQLASTPDAFAALLRRAKANGLSLMVGGVESPAQYERLREVGFDYFQGYFFTVPQIDPERELSSSELAITGLMALLASDAENAEVENALKRDVALGLRLLRLVNTPAFGQRVVDSLRQALLVVGRNQLSRWLQLMLYTHSDQGVPSIPLLSVAATRARLIEVMAQKLRPVNRSIADSGFTVGIMSLMDALFCMPLEEVLKEMPVGSDVIDALIRRQGLLGNLLTVAQLSECIPCDTVSLRRALGELGLTAQEFYLMQLSAYEWSDAIASQSTRDTVAG